MQIVHNDNRLITADCDSGKLQTRPLVRESALWLIKSVLKLQIGALFQESLSDGFSVVT
jgi:hypothetical protein